MKNEAKFHETISILVNAYLNDTLQKDNCYACAVGNIVASKNGYEFKKCNMAGRRFVWAGFNSIYDPFSGGHPMWTKVFFTDFDDVQIKRPENLTGEVKRQIDSTGYRWKDLAKVEYAFEKEKYNFNGLMAVVEVLAEIHEIDLSVKESAKLLFVK